jgi:hypothetical protein
MDLDAAIRYFLPDPSGDLATDLVNAAREAARRRKQGPAATAEVVAALHGEPYNLTYAEIELASFDEKIGSRISRATAERLVSGRGS